MRQGWIRGYFILALAAALMMGGAKVYGGAAHATAEASFKGKTIRILVGLPPGGTADLEARLIARHMPRHLPGNPSILVQNMPGAAGDVMITHLYGRAKPDGLTAGIALSGQKLAVPAGTKVLYDLSKMPLFWATGSPMVHIVRDTLKAKNASELRKVDPSEIVVAGRSAVDVACRTGRLALDILGIKGYNPVCRYPGVGLIRTAMERAEATYFVALEAYLVGGGAFAEMVEKRTVIPLWQHGRIALDGGVKRSPTLPNIPTLDEAYREVHGKPPSGVMWETMLAVGPKMDAVIKTYHLPPGTSKEMVHMWREAMIRLEKDPSFLADWEKTFEEKLGAVVASVELADKVLLDYSTPAPWHEFFRKFVAAVDH